LDQVYESPQGAGAVMAHTSYQAQGLPAS